MRVEIESNPNKQKKNKYMFRYYRPKSYCEYVLEDTFVIFSTFHGDEGYCGFSRKKAGREEIVLI